MSPTAKQKIIKMNKLAHLIVVHKNLKSNADLVCRTFMDNKV